MLCLLTLSCGVSQIMEAYETGVRALRQALDDPRLNPKNVNSVMDSLSEVSGQWLGLSTRSIVIAVCWISSLSFFIFTTSVTFWWTLQLHFCRVDRVYCGMASLSALHQSEKFLDLGTLTWRGADLWVEWCLRAISRDFKVGNSWSYTWLNAGLTTKVRV